MKSDLLRALPEVLRSQELGLEENITALAPHLHPPHTFAFLHAIRLLPLYVRFCGVQEAREQIVNAGLLPRLVQLLKTPAYRSVLVPLSVFQEK